MSSDSHVVIAENLTKTFRVFERNSDRLKQLLSLGRKQYGRNFTALNEVSFTLKRGEVLGLVGNNGAGKSTLLQLICGTLSPSAGKVSVNGRIAALLELGAGFSPEFTGRENIFLNGAIIGLSQTEILDRFDDIVEFSGIGAFIDQPVKTYSSGMYVRLAFSIATSVDPDILVIDEALSVGDGAFARKSFDRIMTLRDAGATIIFCSHSMYHIESICSSALWLERGLVRMFDTPAKVTRAYSASMVSENTPSDAEKTKSEGKLASFLSLQVSFDGATARSFTLAAGTSGLTVDVTFAFDPSYPPPSVAFGLETASGIAVSSGSTFFDDFSPTITSPGKGAARLVFGSLPLMKGSYRLSVFLACERTLHVYDQALYCAEIEITHGGTEQGICFLPRTWISTGANTIFTS